MDVLKRVEPTEYKDITYEDANEHFALVFSAFAIGSLLLIFALRNQRKRIYRDNLLKQRVLLSQLFDMYMVRTVAMRIRKQQLDAHRHVLKKGQILAEK